MADETILKGLLKQVAQVTTEYPLHQFQPMGVGGVADFFVEVQDTIELATALKAAVEAQVPYYVLGSGRGVLFSDGGFPGLVIHNRSRGFALTTEHSQVAVDAGHPLSSLVTQAASQGLGGLTDFYGEMATVGGAIYADLVSQQGSPFLSSVRYLTCFVPPARIDREVKIVRYRADWLFERDQQQTRLYRSKQSHDLHHPQTIILSAVLQLTSVRSDELFRRLNQIKPVISPPRSFGPVFQVEPDWDINLLLRESGASSLRVGAIFPDRYQPNYLRSRGLARAADIRALVEQMQQRVLEVYGITLAYDFELAGIW